MQPERLKSPSRIVIFSGGSLGPWAVRLIRHDDLLIGADAGALFLIRQGLSPYLAAGDFDSVSEAEALEIESASRHYIECDPVMKDLTDTEMAFNWALDRQPAEIILCGVLGTRWDHSLANIHLLRKGLDAEIRCVIIDAHNEITVMDNRKPLKLHRGRHSHVSLLPLSLDVTGITLEGFQYPLFNASLTIGQSLGISNVLLQPEGLITISGGLLLVIQSSDVSGE
ncbi:MAG: thiamine pyrophosphokinae [Paenibacillus sp.]|jgi:thiamine pyrophosphokinase|nr:thiamine pyrophosphokinae [Paenibacillus sp.]